MCLPVPESYVAVLGSRLGPESWLRSHESEWKLILEEPLVRRVLALKQSQAWNVVAKELGALISSSRLGARLFGFAAKSICAESIQQILAAKVATLRATASLTTLVVCTLRNEALEQVRQLEGVRGLAKKREIWASYRGWDLQWEANTVEDECEIRLQTALRAIYSQKKVIQQLPGEDQLCDYDAELKVVDIEPRLYCKAEACRHFLRTLVDGQDFDGEHLQVNRS